MARRKPHNPAREYQTTDTGPDTPAQWYGAKRYRPKDGRGGEVRKQRVHPLERMAERGVITQQEKEAGFSALNLYEATQRSPDWVREYVDRSPNPDLGAVLACDAGFKYARAVREIPVRCLRVYRHVVESGRPIIQLRGCRTNHDERKRQVKLLRWALNKLVV